jgi:phosphonate transport system substrate-binding protein
MRVQSWFKFSTGALLTAIVSFTATSALSGASTIAPLIKSSKIQFDADSQAPAKLAQGQPASLKIVFPGRADKADLQQKSDAIAKFLETQLKMPVEAQVADETAAVEALRANRADIAFLGSRGALKAAQLANAKVYLANVRPNYSGGYTYRSVFVVRQDSPLRSQASNKQTLEQLRGKKMVFTSPTSGSGFIFPVSELVKLGMVQNRDRLGQFFSQVSYGSNYSGALQALLRGQGDVAAVSEYALKPPYITDAEGKQLRILAAIPGVPSHGISFDDDIPAAQREKIIVAMLKLNEPANNQMLKDLDNSTRLVRIDHDRHLTPMREALVRAGFKD